MEGINIKERKTYINKFLKSIIYNDFNIDFSEIKDIDWNLLFEESMNQNIASLIYFAIIKNKMKEFLDRDLIKKWSKYIFLISLKEMRQMKNIENIIEKFNEKEIKIIVLKGAVLKSIYPKAEFRTMGDFDFIIKEDSFNHVEEILKSLEYKKNITKDKNETHESFYRNNEIVEVHWKLINGQFLSGSEDFEKEIWGNLRKIKIGNQYVYSLNHEYMFVYLIKHMAVHIIASGFGFRQLLDLTIFVKKYKDEINWVQVEKMLKKYYLVNFSISIHFIIENLFNYSIFCNEILSSELKEMKRNQKKNTEVLIKYIFDGGIFGKKSKVSGFSNTLVNSRNNYETQKSINKFIFPKIENMGEKYNYAKKYKILIVVAWIHHFFVGVFNREFSIKDKCDFFFKTSKRVDNKEEMLKKLGLIQNMKFNTEKYK